MGTMGDVAHTAPVGTLSYAYKSVDRAPYWSEAVYAENLELADVASTGKR